MPPAHLRSAEHARDRPADRDRAGRRARSPTRRRRTDAAASLTPCGRWSSAREEDGRRRSRPRDATIAGSAGPRIGRDGTVYITTAAGTAPLSSSLFALEPKTLKLKGVGEPSPARASRSSPLVLHVKDKDVVAAAGKR